MKFISGVRDLKKYEYFLVDQWGVVHDGRKKFLEAYRALEFLNKIGKKIIIISNSSENARFTINKTLKKLKINQKIFKKIITSGQIFESEIKNIKSKFKKKQLKCYCISELDKKKLLKKNNILTSEKTSNIDFILASSIRPESDLNLFKQKLDVLLKKKVQMICTNPDKTVYNGKKNKLVDQVGILASYYKNKGGKVIYYGKPYLKIYKECLSYSENVSKKKVLMIGDSMENDILGAQNFKIDSLFILNGNNKDIFVNLNRKKKIKVIVDKWPRIKPTYLLDKLKI